MSGLSARRFRGKILLKASGETSFLTARPPAKAMTDLFGPAISPSQHRRRSGNDGEFLFGHDG
jgi:hypothetical protein